MNPLAGCRKRSTVGVDLGVFSLLRLLWKLIAHRILQYRLCTGESHIVETRNGKVRGLKRVTVYGHSYYGFEGIPYAQPPLGELRFRPPLPVRNWEGVRDCTNRQYVPIQKHWIARIAVGTEDCLYLNVYTKKLDSDRPLPVMVWIYGGSFQIGEATRDMYMPDYFMSRNVILVTFNYRLASLGFLSLNDPSLGVSGNAGLKDQLLAVKWVKENISRFNGDENNITLFGESAGAASVHFLMLNKMAEGLFHKAILQSGCALNCWALVPSEDSTHRLARKLGYNGPENDQQILDFLQRADAKALVLAENDMSTAAKRMGEQFITFGPYVEPYVTDGCALPTKPKEMLPAAWSNNIPVLMGYCSNEGLLRCQEAKWALNKWIDYEHILPWEVRDLLPADELREHAVRLRAIHFSAKDPTKDAGFFLEYIESLSYKMFFHGIYRALRGRLKYAPAAPTYFYRFDFNSAFNQVGGLFYGKEYSGSCHADDLSYQFYTILSHKLEQSSREYRTIERMVDIWTSFAAHSDPNCSAIESSVWPPVKDVDIAPMCLNIADQPKVIAIPELPKLKVWDSFYGNHKMC